MMDLDLHTLILMNLIGTLLNVVAVAMVWGQYRRRYPGIGFWLADTVLQVGAILLIALRGRVPDVVSIVAANLMAQGGIFLLLIGLGRFLGRRVHLGPNLVFLGVFTGVFIYWGLVEPNLTARNIILAATMAFQMAQVGWLSLAGGPRSVRAMTHLTGVTAVAFVAVNLARIAGLATSPEGTNDFFRAGNSDGLFLLAYMTLSLLLIVSLVLLLTRRLRADAEVQEEKFSKAFHSAPYAILLTRAADGTIFELNQGFEDITGFHRSEVLGRTTPSLQVWASDDDRTNLLEILLAGGQVRNREMTLRRKSGELFTGLVTVERITIGDEQCLISSIGDITEQQELRRRLEELATHDSLTGLPNRRLLTDRFAVALSNADRNGAKLAVVSLDLDRFKEVNDRWGHETGDAVLVEAARRLTSCLRKVDTVARFGGDEFVLLLWEVGEPNDAAQAARKILDAFLVPFEVGPPDLVLRASLGIALYPDDGTDLPTLLRKSDQALYAVKGHGRNGFRFTPAS